MLCWNGALLFLVTKRGRIVLFATKLFGLILDIVALDAANTTIDMGFGIKTSSGLFEAVLIIFLFEIWFTSSKAISTTCTVVFNKEWLNNIGNDYGEYYQLFIQNGFEDFETICTLNDQSLIDIGIDQKDHRIKLLLKFNEITTQQNDANNEHIDDNPVKDDNDNTNSGKTNTTG